MRLILLIALLTLTACNPTVTWQQKLTLVVETLQGEVTGSAVVEVTGQLNTLLPGLGNEVVYHYTGEATVVEVAPGRYLFALLGGTEERFYWAARDRFEGLKRPEWLPLIPEQTEPVVLSLAGVPQLVTFDDITRPETLREVDPGNLAAIFGPGVRLNAAVLEITDEPVTANKLDSTLPWLNEIGGGMLDGSSISRTNAANRLANDLTLWDFRRLLNDNF